VTWLVRMCTYFSLVYICALFVNPNYFSVFISVPVFPLIFMFQDFVGVSSTDPHKTSFVHLGKLRGLKGLLHTLNATMIPMKVS